MKSLFTLLTSKGQLFSLILSIVCIAIVFFTIFGGLKGAGYETSTDLVPILLDEDSTEEFNFFGPAVSIPVVLGTIGFILIGLFLIKDIVSDPKGSMKLIIGLVVLAIVFFLLYSTANLETTGKISELVQEFKVSDNQSKLITGGIKMTVGLAIATAISMIAMEIWNLFK